MKEHITGSSVPVSKPDGHLTTIGERPHKAGGPAAVLSLTDAIALIVGIVIGAGIFRAPSLVAANTSSSAMFILVWILGGVVSLVGALCYAELTTTFPHPGGDYHYIRKAFGKRLAFLFAWARICIIQTGSIALLAFIFGDYASRIFSLGEHSSVIYAALVVTSLTVINIMGITFGTAVQKILTAVEVLGIIMIILAGFFLNGEQTTVQSSVGIAENGRSFSGLAMVIVLLTFGGWNEAAYISAELRSGKRVLARALIISIVLITLIYVLANAAYLRVLGLEKMAASEAVAVDMIQVIAGPGGALMIGILVAISSLTSANATIFTGARTNYALGHDFPVLRKLSHWTSKSSAPVNAFLIQGAISLALISLGLITRHGFETMLEYTAPVFWFFFLMVGIALFVLRYKEPGIHRPFRVPFYPVIPIIFCLISTYLLYSSVVYTGLGALVGIGVLMAGVLFLFVLNRPEAPRTV